MRFRSLTLDLVRPVAVRGCRSWLGAATTASGTRTQAHSGASSSVRDRSSSSKAWTRAGSSDKLQRCENGPFRRSTFSIAHRGAPLQFPEHTKESYEAGALQGAGIVECDVTFTKDGELVCRHAECDLHTTTNIVATELNNKCSVPWSGAGSSPKCCTSDLTLQEFKSLQGKMDASNPAATTAEGFLGGTADFRTDLYNSRGTLLTLRESIALNKRLGVKHTPELKEGDPQRIMTVFGGQENYAQRMIDAYKEAGVDPRMCSRSRSTRTTSSTGSTTSRASAGRPSISTTSIRQ